MIVKVLPVGMLRTNCYIVADEYMKEAVVIDPGSKPEKILDALEELDVSVKYIVFTHGHYDHIVAAHYVQQPTGARLLMHKGDEPYLTTEAVSKHGRYTTAGYVEVHPDDFLADGDTFTVGDLEFQVLNTPGHSPGSICLLCGEYMFSGDTLFKGTCGRWDLIGGDQDTMMQSLKRLAELPGDYKVLPGHESATTLQYERDTNRLMQEALAK